MRPGSEEIAKSFAAQRLASRATGSEHAYVYVGELQPGGSGPPLHIHRFDQFYFVLEGALDVRVGLDRQLVGPRTLAILPAGVPHSQRNAGEGIERHLVVNIPQPQAGEEWDIEVDFTSEPPVPDIA
jgi:uncharacterized cupin superfamily protein